MVWLYLDHVCAHPNTLLHGQMEWKGGVWGEECLGLARLCCSHGAHPSARFVRSASSCNTEECQHDHMVRVHFIFQSKSCMLRIINESHAQVCKFENRTHLVKQLKRVILANGWGLNPSYKSYSCGREIQKRSTAGVSNSLWVRVKGKKIK